VLPAWPASHPGRQPARQETSSLPVAEIRKKYVNFLVHIIGDHAHNANIAATI